MSKLTDLEIIRKIKEGDTWYQSQLWKRYQGQVYINSKRIKSRVGNRMEMEDISQELFFAFNDAVNYFDLKKVKIETFHFSTIFFFFIKKTEEKILKKVIRMNNLEFSSFSYDEIFTEDESSLSVLQGGPSKFRNIIPESYYDKDMIHRKMESKSKAFSIFFNSLSSEEKEILEEILQSKKMSVIAKEKNVSYYQVRKIFLKIKESAKDFWGEYLTPEGTFSYS